MLSKEMSVGKVPATPQEGMRKMSNKQAQLKVYRSDLSRNLDQDLTDREQELRQFRIQTQNAVVSPLLTQALVKKTEDMLDAMDALIEEREEGDEAKSAETNFGPYEKFRQAAKVISILCFIACRWRRYDSSLLKRVRQQPTGSPMKRKRQGLMSFDTKSFYSFVSKVPEEARDLMKVVPWRRTQEQIKKVQNYCRKVRVFQKFPIEKEPELAKVVGYACYDCGRVLCEQDRPTDRFYFVLSGRISKVQTMSLTDGIRKQYFADLHQSSSTDVDEVVQQVKREYSLICHTAVEVLILERDDLLDVFSSKTIHRDSTLKYLQSIDLFSTYPLHLINTDQSITMRYYSKGAVICETFSENPYIVVIKSGKTTLYLDTRHAKHKNQDEEHQSSIIQKLRGTQIKDQQPATQKHSTPKSTPTGAPGETFNQTAQLNRGDIHGLESILARALAIVQAGITGNYIYNGELPTALPSKLVSGGAECVLISKSEFIKNADFCTLCKLTTRYLNEETVTMSKQNCQPEKWKRYKEELTQQIIQSKSKK